MIPRWQRTAIFFVLGFASIPYAAAEWDVQLGVESFRWREFDSGAQLLEETGPRLRATVEWRQDAMPEQSSLIELRGSIYGGGIDYNGQACTLAGSCVPFKTDASYVGLQGEGLVSWRFGANRDTEVFAGGGLDSWHRDIKGSGNVAGAIEDWSVFYALAGVGGYLTQSDTRYRSRLGVKYPIYATNTPDGEDVTLEPKGQVSLFVNLSADFLTDNKARWGIGLYYDSYRFGASDKKRIASGTQTIIIFQPESRQDLLGIYGTIYF